MAHWLLREWKLNLCLDAVPNLPTVGSKESNVFQHIMPDRRPSNHLIQVI